MFNLEKSIAEWRRQALAAGLKTPSLLDELESHLREDMRALVSAGRPEAQAFELAVSRLGKPGLLRTEFNKLKSTACWPVTIGVWVYAGVIISMAVSIAMSKWMLVQASKMGLVPNPFILYAHVVSVTAGYMAGFWAGFFGMLYLSYRLFRSLTALRQQSLGRAVFLFSRLAAGLVIVGFVLGMIWCHQRFGKYLLGDPKELGGSCVVLWFVVLAVMQRTGRLSERAAMLMCIGGNVIVSLAWFGTGILVSSPAWRQHGMASYIPLALSVFLGMNLLFLAIGMAPAPE